MPLPEAVRKQQERADELHRQMYQAQEDEGDNSPEPVPEPEPEPQPQEPAPKQAEGEPEPPKAPEESLEAKLARLERAHETLQGKYRAEVPRLQEENRDLISQLQEAKSQANQAQAQARDSEQRNQELTGKLQEYRQKLSEEFGEEFADTMSNMARDMAAQEVSQYREQQAKTDQERFMAAVRRNVADFDTVNTDPAFVQWLRATVDPQTGFSYQETLTHAGQQLDLNTVVRVFSDYAKATQSSREAAPENQIAAPKGGGASARREARPQYTVDDYKRLQHELTHTRKWVGREAEAAQLEREIHAALHGD